MAKAKKPASPKKSATQKPNPDASKPDVTAAKSADKASASKASQAAASKPDSTVSAPEKDVKTPAATKTTSAATKPAADVSDPSPAASKATSASGAKAVSAASDTKAKTTTASPAGKQTEAKDIPAKSESTAKPDNAKPASKTPDAPVKAATSVDTSKTVKPEPARQPEKSGSVFWPLVFGGVIAGGIGFAVSEMNVLNTRVDTDAIKETLRAQQEQIAAIQIPDLSGIESSVTDLESGIAGLSDSVASFDTRLVELENRPIVATDGSVAGPSQAFLNDLEALKASAEEQKNEIAQLLEDAQQLDVLRSEVEEQNTEIARLLEDAQSVEEATAEAALAAAVQAASAKITAALSSGAAYDTAIEDLAAAGVDDLPAGLTDPASDGVATLLSLQTEFPGAARAGLASARAAGVDAGTGGVGGFLKRQLSARSVAPREGSDPDAVLSRAEAAVREGRVGDALTELDGLPTEVQTAMEDWLAQARTRAAAEAAVQDLSERLTAN